jgi:hypothetical protein
LIRFASLHAGSERGGSLQASVSVMVESQSHAAPLTGLGTSTTTGLEGKPTAVPIPVQLSDVTRALQLKDRNVLDTYSSVNQNGSFEFDRVIKCGYVQKRTQKTKVSSMLSKWSRSLHC